MKTTEEQIRDLLTHEERRAPLAADAMPGIQRGIVRSKQRRVGAVVAAVVAVAAAITVPIAVHGSPQSRPVKTPTATHSTKPTTRHYVGLTRMTTFAPTWLPAGVVESGRQTQLHSKPGWPAFASRSFSDPNNTTGISVSDFSASAHVPKTGTVPVKVADRSGKGWVTTDPKGYEIQVKWKPGHWLDITADSTATALRVGNSIVDRAAPVNLPVTFQESSTVRILNVSGTSRAPYVEMIGTHLVIEINQSRDSEPTTRALGHGLYAHVGPLSGATSYPKSEYLAISKSFRVHGKLVFSWLGKRP